jgi:hypothetical protein
MNRSHQKLHRRLLRARRERLRHRTAEKRYELAASQFIELHSIASSQDRKPA